MRASDEQRFVDGDEELTADGDDGLAIRSRFLDRDEDLVADRDEIFAQLLRNGGGLLRQNRFFVHAHDQSWK
jgi:hypothetical protein